ncbi:MAG: amidase [Longimonas sp.]|uniref:amidase n=1 Tax=Longimonas sp. TaxID=2039626 RepID=UPI00334B5EDE
MASPLADPRMFPDATELAERVQTGKTTVPELLQTHVERLKAVQPALNAATDCLTDRIQRAIETPPEGPWAGIPVSVKETYGLKGEPLTAGSKRAPTLHPDEDAALVKQITSVGGVICARGNIPEFAMTHETENLLYGRTHNPLNPDRSPGGSSGGDAALVASGAVAVGFGSDLGGSVRHPAHCCGIVGFKPASGDIDDTGTWPLIDEEPPEPLLADSMLALGPLTRSVRDAKQAYEWARGRSLSEAPPLDTLRLVKPADFTMTARERLIPAAVDYSRRQLEQAGLRSAPMRLPDAGALYQAYLTVVVRDYATFLYDSLTTRDGKALSWARESWRQLRKRPTVHWYLFRLLAAMHALRPDAQAGWAAEAEIQQARRTIRDQLGDNGIVLLPTNGTLAMKPGDAATYMSRPGIRGLFTPTIYPNVLNLPAITVPAWTHQDARTGLVPGVQLIAAPGSEAALFAAAEALESHLRDMP